MKKAIYITIIILYVTLTVWVFVDHRFISHLQEMIGSNFYVGSSAYVLLMITSVVVAPLSFLPLIAIGSSIFGPFLTGVLNVFGWWVGAVIAFYIARYGARPIVGRLFPISKLVKYEDILDDREEFWTVVILRALTPVDILSYVLGTVTTMTWRKHAVATLLGITPFAFVYAYGGAAIVNKNVFLLSIILAIGIVLFFILRIVFKRLKEGKDGKNDKHSNS